MSETEKQTTRAHSSSSRAPQKHSLQPTPQATRRTVTIVIVLFIVAVVVAITGIIPRMHARAALRKETDSMAVPDVSVVTPQMGEPMQEVLLPGTIQAYTDAPIYARTNGYVKAWYHDIGAHVHKGELLAVIETPELDRQVDEARASLNTAKANLGLAKVTAQRYEGLRGTEAVSKQSIDTATQTESAQAASVVAAQQTLNQMLEMQSFERVYAPFDGVITARNIDVGQLVDSGSNGGTGSSSNLGGNVSTTGTSTNGPQELFHISSMDTVRIFVSVPGVYVSEARPGVKTDIDTPAYPGRIFKGTIVRTADAINLNTRTLLVEVDIPNPKHALLPGAYGQVHLQLPIKHPAMIIPVDTLLFRSEGLRVVTVDAQNHAHLKVITVGRDWGTRIEVLSGLTVQDRVINNPPDSITENEAVNVVDVDGKPVQQGSSSGDGTPANSSDSGNPS
ncbi:MAG TPA: efflux RND transporter periplasmic adaptor subunit [Acidobacteriaceae bacterium]|nr:efflux RND transporter periplasmic adaptor subunit [Acidobacteriaceae bacterium]